MTGGRDHAQEPPAESDRAFGCAVALNAGFVAIGAGFGFIAGSLALQIERGGGPPCRLAPAIL